MMNNEGDGLAEMLETGQFADLTITCGVHTFMVHRIILASKSTFFKAACGGRFLEAQTATINLPEDEPSILARVFLFLYTTDYPATRVSAFAQFHDVDDQYAVTIYDNWDWRLEIELHAVMYAAGRKYGIDQLSDCAQFHFLDIMYRDSNDVKHQPSKLAPGTWGSRLQFTEHNARIIRLVYATTPATDRGLRDVVVYDMHNVLEHPYEGDHVAIQLIRTLPDLAVDLATTKFTKSKLTRMECGFKTSVLVWPCACCSWIGCPNDACSKVDTNRSFCTKCMGVGVFGMKTNGQNASV